MAVYIIVGLVVVAGLIVAYRSIGRPATKIVDPLAVLRAVLDAATASSATDSQDAARGARRRLEACAQELERVDASSLDEAGYGARAQLAVALDELVWWARLAEVGAEGSGLGMQRAAGALREDALRCLDDAGRTLAASETAKVRDRSL